MTLILFGHALPLEVVLRAMDVTHLNTPIKERIALLNLDEAVPPKVLTELAATEGIGWAKLVTLPD